MTLKKAIKIICADWEVLYKKQQEGYNYSGLKNSMIVVAISDTSQPYEIDQELIGISPQGNIFWAYASCCSCWDGDYKEDTKPTIKEFKLVHEHTPEDWQSMIIKFAETKKVQNLK